MRLQLDFDNKTIKIESSTNLGELIAKLEKMIPNWKEFKLEVNTIIQWYSYPVYKYGQPWVGNPIYSGTSGLSSPKSTLTLSNTTNAINYNSIGDTACQLAASNAGIINIEV